MEAVKEQLKQLSEGGRAAERFDALLDAELQAVGFALPDWAQSHFSGPRRKKQACDGDGQAADEAGVMAIVLMMFLLVPMLVFSSVFFMMASPMSGWDI